MDGQHLADLITDPVQWRQRGHRFLKDHAETITAQGTQFFILRRQGGEINRRRCRLTLRFRIEEQDFALLYLGAIGQQAHDRIGDHRFTGTALADKRRYLARRNGQRNIVNGLHRPLQGSERN